MAGIFANDPDALLNIGNRACSKGLVDLEKANYMKIAVDAYNKVLENL